MSKRPGGKSLTELRQLRGRAQAQMARSLGQSQASIARSEHSRDMRLGTLRNFISALGGTVEIRVRFPETAPIVVSGLCNENAAPVLPQNGAGNADTLKLILAKRVFLTLRKLRLTDYAASLRTGVDEADFLRIRRYELDSFTVDDLLSTLLRLGVTDIRINVEEAPPL